MKEVDRRNELRYLKLDERETGMSEKVDRRNELMYLKLDERERDRNE